MKPFASRLRPILGRVLITLFILAFTAAFACMMWGMYLTRPMDEGMLPVSALVMESVLCLGICTFGLCMVWLD